MFVWAEMTLRHLSTHSLFSDCSQRTLRLCGEIFFRLRWGGIGVARRGVGAHDRTPLQFSLGQVRGSILSQFRARSAHDFQIAGSESILIKIPPTTERAWNATCVPSRVQYQSVRGTRVGDWLTQS